jgi:hypothetical protein
MPWPDSWFAHGCLEIKLDRLINRGRMYQAFSGELARKWLDVVCFQMFFAENRMSRALAVAQFRGKHSAANRGCKLPS